MLNAFPRLLYLQKKNPFTGDHCGMRFRMAMVAPEEGEKYIQVWLWPEPLCFEAADKDAMTLAQYPPTEDGYAAACDWVRAQYTEQIDLWNAHYTKPIP